MGVTIPPKPGAPGPHVGIVWLFCPNDMGKSVRTKDYGKQMGKLPEEWENDGNIMGTNDPKRENEEFLNI